METCTRFIPLRSLTALIPLLILLSFKEAMAAKHVVGGSSGWDESTDFNSWASAQTFKVGDELEFKYSSGLHSVVELGDESAFKSCDVAGSSLKSYNSGSDSIKLTKTGTRYFACGTSGHCDQGMKVKITTVAADAPSTTTSTTPSSQGGTGTDSAASASSGATSTPQLQFLCAFILIASSLAFLVLLV